MADDHKSEALWSDEYLSFTLGTLLRAGNGDMIFLIVGLKYTSLPMMHILYYDVYGGMKLSICSIHPADFDRCSLVSRP